MMRQERALARTRGRRGLGAISAAVAVMVIAASAAPSSATPTGLHATTVRRVVHTSGRYLVVVRLPTAAVAQDVTVTVGTQTQANVALSTSAPQSLAFYTYVGHHFTVRLVTTGPAVRFQLSSSRLTASSTGTIGPTGATGATGSSGATGATGPLVLTAAATGSYKKLVWSANFNGPAGAPPDPSTWTADNGGGCGPGTLTTNTQSLENASLDGLGNLSINAIASPAGYTSAQLDTAGAFAFQYGRIEARIEQPAGQGLCSAFWLLGGATQTNCWPGCGEIDVMEAIGDLPDQANAFLHGPTTGSPNNQQFATPVTSTGPLTSGFHTYGLTWRPNSLTWTLDGVPYATVTRASLPAGSQWVFSGHPFHILLDLAVGGWPGPPNASTAFPASMRVSWVRVYQ